jgi:hypothetical protein
MFKGGYNKLVHFEQYSIIWPSAHVFGTLMQVHCSEHMDHKFTAPKYDSNKIRYLGMKVCAIAK